jgi:hypothetical protein
MSRCGSRPQARWAGQPDQHHAMDASDYRPCKEQAAGQQQDGLRERLPPLGGVNTQKDDRHAHQPGQHVGRDPPAGEGHLLAQGQPLGEGQHCPGDGAQPDGEQQYDPLWRLGRL